jgi:hypothetical protein
MESNDVVTYLCGWGVSIAIQRAKERQNPSPDELVMVKTVNQPRLKLGGAVVPLARAVVPLLERPGVPVFGWQKYQGMGGAVVPPWGAGCTAFVGKCGRKLMISVAKLLRIRGWKVGGTYGEARSTSST